MKKYLLIKSNKSQAKRLRALALVPREPYYSIIDRLISQQKQKGQR